MSHPPLAVFPRVEQSSVTPAHPYSISTQLCCDSEVFQHKPFPASKRMKRKTRAGRIIPPIICRFSPLLMLLSLQNESETQKRRF
ncbi:hypothetical protein Q7C36_003843 [Tachysurus vachellii]|uniref:Uncharacterized protein n=1 Tax=Tachysurus vachellii TaxID=175792 RepID=A0AA88T7T4_TACVA|nr:hypothetical protein Q7C36_003843 [Tachysurus vachellii]